MKHGTNFHTNAALLVVKAAEKSGLLQEIAQTLNHAARAHGLVGCPACELLKDLTEAFDDHICLPGGTLESFHGEGFNLPEATEEEIAPYLGIRREVAAS